jgi:hypothetical protein
MHYVLDFVQILFAVGVPIINENNVFDSFFFRPGNHMTTIFGVYYCQIFLYFLTCLDTIPQNH